MGQTTSFDCMRPIPKTPYEGLWDTLEIIGQKTANLLKTGTQLKNYSPVYRDYLHPQLIRASGDPFILLEKTGNFFSRIFLRKKERVILKVCYNFGKVPAGEIKYLVKTDSEEVKKVIVEELQLFQEKYGTVCLELQEIFNFPRH